MELEDETINETGKKRRPERQQVNCHLSQREEKNKIKIKHKIQFSWAKTFPLRSGRLQQVLDREGQAPTPFGLVSLQIKKSADSKQTEVQIKN